MSAFSILFGGWLVTQVGVLCAASLAEAQAGGQFGAQGEVLTDAPPALPIPAFKVVDSGIYRGGRPAHDGMIALSQQLSIKTDLDLEDDPDAIAAEAVDARTLGMRLVSIPMSGFFAPHDSAVNDALAVLRDPSNYPLFVHCLHGEDRTGLVVGLFRVEAQGVAPADAYQEMKDDGFHPLLIGLNYYFEKRVGLFGF